MVSEPRSALLETRGEAGNDEGGVVPYSQAQCMRPRVGSLRRGGLQAVPLLKVGRCKEVDGSKRQARSPIINGGKHAREYWRRDVGRRPQRGPEWLEE